METAFDAIGIEITNETAFNNLAEDVEKRGEASHLTRKTGVLHGRCLKLGDGLEIWTVLYETGAGEVSCADCRPAFRARFSKKISPWILTEADEEGKAIVHGFVEGFDTEVLFELQNLTEIGTEVFKRNSLQIGLCGLAYSAEVLEKAETSYWKSFDEIALNVIADENVWSLCGRVIAFETLRNPFSGNDLYWLYLDLGELKLEILANRRILQTEKIAVGKFVRAEVWLQGHIVGEVSKRFGYEGVDRSHRTVDFWKQFKKLN
ncbi:MAG: hypothetical protein M3525_05140 [Acidobacteriota bacterium]|nr:hypothetical protein [Acidobacteriota bacterium]